MDCIPLCPLKRPQKAWSRSVLWMAGMSTFLLTGFASGSGDNNFHSNSRMPAQADGLGSVLNQKAGKQAALSGPITASDVIVAPKPLPLPTIDRASFNQRFGGPKHENPIQTSALSLDKVGEFDNSRAELPGEAAGSANAQRQRTVHSPISVFSFEPRPAPPLIDPATEPDIDARRSPLPPRPDLLCGIPEDYARLAVAIADAEEVDPNWVLAVMRAENADFDPRLVSSAGAIGLMQVMPRIGETFGANDLTDPEQNIRAGTRFLRILIDKYRNPVLVAAAYNAGEPNVDLRHSLPLIRETADYVTRVVGFYTGGVPSPSLPHAGTSSGSEPSSKRRAGSAERAKSPMLVFSVAKPIPPEVRPRQEEGHRDAAGPVKIVKEEVLQ